MLPQKRSHVKFCYVDSVGVRGVDRTTGPARPAEAAAVADRLLFTVMFSLSLSCVTHVDLWYATSPAAHGR
ncbi:hypothetical protein F2P81_010727 [Scophthalmus maximus]|uniref:Uncharacterized protein n=1 Tax=Scophthalmus maximus TaxID=52904 RepID=A0A6A4SV70_SCOMX|nr:hypothetical protein F2P81_010727 [Scophthalmus maximus]